MVRTPGEIFSYMNSNKIGVRVSLFWIAWAFVTEKLKNFKMTDQIFQKGMKRYKIFIFIYIIIARVKNFFV
jgi:hypothetical protein